MQSNCSRGGIGRHAILRGWCPHGRAGSTPAVSTEKNHSETDGFSFLIYLFSVIYISVQDSIEEFKIKPIVKNKIGIKVPFEDYSEKSVKLILKLRVDDVRKRNFMFLSKLCIDIQDDII